MNALPTPLSSGFLTEDVDLLESWAYDACVDELIQASTSKTLLDSVNTPRGCMGGNMLGLSKFYYCSPQPSDSSSDSQEESLPLPSPSSAPSESPWTEPLLWHGRFLQNNHSCSIGRNQQHSGPEDDLLSSSLTLLKEYNDSMSSHHAIYRKLVNNPATLMPETASVSSMQDTSKRETAGTEHSSKDRTERAGHCAEKRRIKGKGEIKNTAGSNKRMHICEADNLASRLDAVATKSSIRAYDSLESFNRKLNVANQDGEKPTSVKLLNDGIVRYVCPCAGCDKHFSTKGHARRHSQIHTRVRRFTCPHTSCEATFTRRDNCTHHQRTQHHHFLRET